NLKTYVMSLFVHDWLKEVADSERAVNKPRQGLTPISLGIKRHVLAVNRNINQKAFLFFENVALLDQLHAARSDRQAGIASRVHRLSSHFFGGHIKTESHLIEIVPRLEIDDGAVRVAWRTLGPDFEITHALLLQVGNDSCLFFRRKAQRVADAEHARIILLEFNLLHKTLEFDGFNRITGREKSGAGTQQRDRRRNPQPHLVLDLLNRSIERDAVLFVSELGKVVINEQREAEAQQQDQVRQN